MKKLLLLAMLGLSSWGAANAQTFVETTVQNKKALLEEYTGIHCQYCPDGHKRAAALAAKNPDKVFLVNIHTGGYAKPSTGEVDLRTALGDALVAQTDLEGYPSGTVNRGIILNRGQWDSAATHQMTLTAPVNVAVKSSVDPATRTLTTEVEYYYTSDEEAATNYLTVYLTQDSILGTQTGGTSYNPDNFTNDGYYLHNHVLRMLISENNLGDAITPTTKGATAYKKFTTVLPENIKSINVDLLRLHVVAVISRTGLDVLNVNECSVQYPNDIVSDLALTNKTELPTDFCFSSITPKVEIKNNSDKTITGFDVTANVFGTELTKTFSGSLAASETTTIEFAPTEIDASAVFYMTLGFNNVIPNTLLDANILNNAAAFSTFVFKDKAFSQKTFGFNTGKMDAYSFQYSTDNGAYYPDYSSSPKIGANNTPGTMLFELYNYYYGVAYKPAYIYFGEAAISEITDPAITFYYAYTDGSIGGTAPKIRIERSTDCAQTWKSIYSETLAETGQPDDPNQFWTPKSTDYVKKTVSLADYKEDAIFRFVVIPGSTGNRMYLDEISFTSTTGINDEENTTVSVYPNPTADFLRINGNTVTNDYSVVNMLGEVVLNGTYNESINVSGLSAGCYYLKMDGKSFNFIKK